MRGIISTAGQKHNVKIASSKSENGDRVYNIVRSLSSSWRAGFHAYIPLRVCRRVLL